MQAIHIQNIRVTAQSGKQYYVHSFTILATPGTLLQTVKILLMMYARMMTY